MSITLDEQIQQLKQAIADLEAQRSILGDAAVEAALIPSRQKLAELEAQAEPSREEPPEIPTRQRKLATILFMDVVGSTEMTHDLDPEDQMALVDPLIARLGEKVSEFGGHVARYTGDGFKAVFGLPLALENDPEQAIRAGLAIQAEASEIASKLANEHGITEFKVRMGITTGLVFAGGETEGEDTIKGNPVNLAARLQSAASPGGLLISHDTYRHVRGVFNVDPIEPITAKGFPEPVPVYLVRELKPRAFRVLTRGVEGVETRMVGRHDELKFLQDALLTAIEEGEGGVVTISGEAGVGKSRLLYEFQNWVELLPATQAVFFFQGSSRQEAQGLPYSLLRDLFAFRFQILDEDTGEQARRKIEMGFCDVFGEGEEGFMKAHILGQLLGFNFSASPHLKGVLNDAEQLRNRALMYLVQYFQALAQEHPVVIFLEDAHWGDDSSLDVINRLGEYVLQHPWLIVCAARPTLFERRPYWGEGQTYHTHLELRPLSKRESRQLVGEILKQAEEIPAELRELVVSGSEGNPFYTEELIKMLIEEGVVIPREDTWGIDLTRLEQIDVPSTLAGVLQARLDSLPLQERTVLQQASVVGRLFWDRIVSYIQAEGGDGSDPELIPLALTSLRNRELVYRHEESAFVGAKEYFFKHDVLREVTYESVLKRLRKTYHGLVADWLIENSGGRISEFCGVIAEHLLLAGRKDQACRYFKMAGNSALASYAAAEAERYFRQAFDLSSDTKSRADILFGYGEALSRKGKNDIALDIWRQAIESYKQFGEFDQMAEVYARLSNVLWHSHGYPEAWKVCKDGLEMMEGASDGPGYAHLLAEAGRTALFQNKSEQALLLCNKAIIMAERLGDMEVSADARITLALREENKTRSIVILKEVVELAAENDLLRTLVRATGSLGVWFNYIFDAATSVQYYMQAIQIGEQIGSNTVQSVSNLIEAYNQLGKINDAEDVLVSKIPKVNAPMREKEIFTLVNQGRILFARGDWDKSLEVLQICLDLLHEGKDFQLIGNRNLEMVESALELNYFDKQRNLHIAEIALQENIDYKHDLADSYLLLSIVFARAGDFQAAGDFLVQAEHFRNRIINHGLRESHTRAKFELAYSEQRWNDAVEFSETSTELYQRSSYLWGWARSMIDLGDAFISRNETGDLERARETYQQSLDTFTEMGAPGYIQELEERLRKM